MVNKINKTRTKKSKTQNTRKKSDTTTGGSYKRSSAERKSAQEYDRAKQEKWVKNKLVAADPASCDEKYDNDAFCMDVFEERKRKCSKCKRLYAKKDNNELKADDKSTVEQKIQNIEKFCADTKPRCRNQKPKPEIFEEPVVDNSSGFACTIL